MTYSRPLSTDEKNAIEVFYFMLGYGALPIGLVAAALWWAWYRYGRKQIVFDGAWMTTFMFGCVLLFAFITRLYLARYWVNRWGGG